MSKKRRPDADSPRPEPLPDEFGADVGVQHVAVVYAKALLGAAEKAGQTADVLEELDALLSEVLDANPRLDAILESWLVPHEDTVGILERVFGGRMSPLLLNYLKVLSRHGRLDVLRPICRQAHLLYDLMRGRVRVRFCTATPVDDALLARVGEQLRAVLGGEAVIEQVVQPDLIGGAVLRIGDTVYDGSVAKQLEILRQQIIDRSVHEIQSRRDRFRYPAGNRAV